MRKGEQMRRKENTLRRADRGRRRTAFQGTRRAVRIAASLCLLALLTACAPAMGTVTVLRTWGTEDAAQAESANGSAYRVGMVTDISGIDDASFNRSAWDGLQALSKSTGIYVGYTQPNSDTEFAEAFHHMAEDGYNIIWGVGYSCADALLETAAEFPDTHFALVDSSYDQMPDNVTCVVFRAEDSSFLVGYIAAYVSRTGKVGFVGGRVSEAIDLFQYGFQGGAAWADHESGRSTEILVEYADSFDDPDRGWEIARSMFQNGCDIVYHAAGSTGTGVIEAAVEAGKYAIGVDRDQAYLAPENVLTSALKRVDVAVMQVTSDWMSGRDVGGQTFLFGLPEGAVGIPEGHNNYPDTVYDAAMRLSDKILGHIVTPPGNQEEFQAFLAELDKG